MLLPESLVSRIGWAIVHSLWQGFLLWAVTGLALYLLRAARPQVRYGIACLALLGCLALPAAGLVQAWSTTPTTQVEVAAPSTKVQDSASPSEALATQAGRPGATTLESALRPHLRLIVLVWLVGSGLFSLRFITGLSWVRRVGSRKVEDASPEWMGRLHRLAERMGIRGSVRLKVSSLIESPMVMGVWRPVILIPTSLLTGMDPSLIEALLAHELAHVRRMDYLVNLVQNGIETVLFYHPAVWWISHRIRIEREQACDDLAVDVLGAPRPLALALKALDHYQTHLPQLAQAAHGGHLMNRIRRIIQPQSHPMALRSMLAIAGIASFCVASTVALKEQPQKAASAASSSQKQASSSGSSYTFTKGASDRRNGEIALVRKQKGSMTFSGSDRSLDEIEGLRSRIDGDFLWFRRDGKGYVIEDPALVAKANEAYAPMTKLGEDMGTLGNQMGELGAKQGELGAQQGEVGQKQGEIGQELGALGRKIGEVARKQAELNQKRNQLDRKLDQARQGSEERKTLEAKRQAMQEAEASLDQKRDALEEAMEALREKMEAAGKPMEALSREMAAFEGPMAELNKKMKVLEHQMEGARKTADQAVQALIHEGLATGKAKPTKGR